MKDISKHKKPYNNFSTSSLESGIERISKYNSDITLNKLSERLIKE